MAAEPMDIISGALAPGEFRLCMKSTGLAQIYAEKEKELQANQRCVLVLLVYPEAKGIDRRWLESLQQINDMPHVSEESKAAYLAAFEKYDPVEKLSIVILHLEHKRRACLVIPKNLLTSMKIYEQTIIHSRLGYVCF